MAARCVSDGRGARASLSVVLACGAVLAGLLVVACGAFSASESAPDPSGDGGGQDGTTNDAPGATTDGGMLAADASDGSSPPLLPVVLASGFATLSSIAATETAVYFVDQQSGDIDMVPLVAGGTVQTLVPTGASPHTIAIANGQLYWSDFGQGTLSRASLTTPVPSLTSVKAGYKPVSIAASAAGVVALLTNTTAPLDGQVVQYDFMLNETGVAVAGQSNPFEAVLFGDQIFWTESAGHRVRRGLFGMTTNDVWSENQVDSETIAADQNGVYWSAGPNVRMSPAAAGSPVLDVSTTEGTPTSLASDGSSVYWLTQDSLRRWNRVPGSAPTTLATGAFGLVSSQFRGIAVTTSYVVWITGDGKVMRLAKSW